MNTHEQDMKDLRTALLLIAGVKSRGEVLGIWLLGEAEKFIRQSVSDSEYEAKIDA
jgi:hypothetical protein